MQDLLHRHLPFEIFETIFSNVTQKDCLELMLVCRLWYDEIPKYTSACWDKINFINASLSEKKTSYHLKRFGQHIKKVEVSYDVIDSILEALKERQSKVTDMVVLDIECNDTPILEYFPRFSNTLLEIGANLVKLVLLDYHEEMPLLDIASICPQLVHLEVYLFWSVEPNTTKQDKIIYDNDSNKSSNSVTTKKQSNVLLPRLLVLGLDNKYSFDKIIEPFLNHCPNVRSLRLNGEYSHFYKCSYISEDNCFDFAHILELCPSLYILEYSFGFREALDPEQVNRVIQHQQHEQPGLRHIIYHDEKLCHYDSILPLVEKAQRTLTFLNIQRNTDNIQLQQELLEQPQHANWSNLLARNNISFPHLQELKLTVNELDPTTISRIISSTIAATTVIETGTAPASNHPFIAQDPFSSSSLFTKIDLQVQSNAFKDNRVIQTLAQLRHLTCLKLSIVPPLDRSNEDARLFPEDDFHHLLQIPLQEISLTGATYLTDNVMVNVLSCFDSLRKISLKFGTRYTSRLTAQGLLQFARNLYIHTHQDNEDGGTLETVKLFGCFSHMDDAWLESLADLRSVRSFTLSGTGMTMEGLKAFVEKIAATKRHTNGPCLDFYDTGIHRENFTQEIRNYFNSQLGQGNFCQLGDMGFMRLNR